MNFDFLKVLQMLLSVLGRDKPKVEEVVKNVVDVIGDLPKVELEEQIEEIDMRVAQELLTKLGFDPGPVDGWPGPLTRKAVMEFQEQNDLEVDGLIGQKTWAALKERGGS